MKWIEVRFRVEVPDSFGFYEARGLSQSVEDMARSLGHAAIGGFMALESEPPGAFYGNTVKP